MNRQRRRVGLAVGTVLAAAVALTGCGQSFGSGGGAQQSGKASLNVLVATGDTASLRALRDLGSTWAKKTGNKIDIQPASDMNQQLSQGFAAGNPPDVFWVDANYLPTYAKAGNLWAYGDKIDQKFYPTLKTAFTYDGKFYCAPKDFSNLGLVINTDMWTEAGLTDADIPTDWSQLESVAKKLTTADHVGLVIGDTRDRVGAFMKQAGGWIVNSDQTKMTIDTPENIEGITEVQKLLQDGVAKFPKQVDSGWGGEAIGTGKAAMTIEGNWFKSAATSDYPKLNWKVAELPAGPAGKGTLTFTQCWGIADASKYHSQALDFLKSIYTPDTQISLAKQFGVMPSITSARDEYEKTVPADERAWLAGADYAQGPVSAPGLDPVMKDLDTLIQQLPGISPTQIVEQTQKNGEAVLNK